jgi:hypothetical protein
MLRRVPGQLDPVEATSSQHRLHFGRNFNIRLGSPTGEGRPRASRVAMRADDSLYFLTSIPLVRMYLLNPASERVGPKV